MVVEDDKRVVVIFMIQKLRSRVVFEELIGTFLVDAFLAWFKQFASDVSFITRLTP